MSFCEFTHAAKKIILHACTSAVNGGGGGVDKNRRSSSLAVINALPLPLKEEEKCALHFGLCPALFSFFHCVVNHAALSPLTPFVRLLLHTSVFVN